MLCWNVVTERCFKDGREDVNETRTLYGLELEQNATSRDTTLQPTSLLMVDRVTKLVVVSDETCFGCKLSIGIKAYTWKLP
jgi:hypothetical protein